MPSTITLHVQETESLDPDDLASFIYLFRGAYGLACREFSGGNLDLAADRLDDSVARVLKAAKRMRLEQLQRLFNEKPTGEDLRVWTISKQSPLEIVLAGSLVCLVIAAVLSGGKIKAGLKGFEAQLNPLGDGIKKLREGLGLTSKGVKTGYSIQTVVVVLSIEEFRLLMEAHRGQGGFQSFFADLQSRVNKRTRRLPLYPPDIDRICRHGREPQKGGFQAKLKKIFGRHLNV